MNADTVPHSAPLRAIPRWIWLPQLAAAAILGQTLFFKFSGAPEAVHIFSTLGVEPIGRIGLGVVELVTALLLLTPRFAGFGGLLAACLMVGAIGSHLTVLGIEVQEDGGALFGMAVVTLLAGALTAFVRRRELPVIGGRFRD